MPTLDSALEYVQKENPELHHRIRIHNTGDYGQPELDGVGAVWFWLGDPLREAYPACFAEAQRIANDAAGRSRLINPPEALSNTIKHVQSKIWQGAGFRVAEHARYGSREELETLLEDFPLPAIARSDRHHSMRGMKLIRSRDRFRKPSGRGLPMPGTLVELIDTRGVSSNDPSEAVWSRYYHKKRSLVLGDRVDRRSVLFSPSPVVKLRTCTYRPLSKSLAYATLGGPGEAGKRWAEYWPFQTAWKRQCIETDNRWWQEGEGGIHDAELVRATNSLGLDIAAIDYSTTADGSLVLWEANPYFYMPRRDSYLLPEARMFERRREAGLKAIMTYLCKLAS